MYVIIFLGDPDRLDALCARGTDGITVVESGTITIRRLSPAREGCHDRVLMKEDTGEPLEGGV